MEPEKETTNFEILQAINDFATHTEGRFEKLETDVGGLKADVGYLKSNMVTKDYLDDKMYDLRGDIISVIKKEDVKLGTLVEILKDKQVLNDNDVKRIVSQAPFPKLYIS